MTDAVLTVEDLTVHYGRSMAVAGVDLEVHSAELVAVAGSNGAGKSSLVNALAGWSRGKPTVSGRIMLDGASLATMPSYVRSRRGLVLVPEGKGVFGQLTVEENLLMVSVPVESRGRRYELDDVLDVFPALRERLDAKCATLSGGERQMVAIARGLRAAPSVLILDEPSIGLAPILVGEVLRHIRELVDDGLAVLLVEQNVKASLEVADRLYLLDRGSIAGHGPAAQMRDDPRVVEAYLGGGEK